MPTDQLLRLERVGKVFGGGLTALADIDLSIAEGEFLSLLGPSGCGKTTTLRAIAGFEVPTSGRILLDGVDITTMPAHERPVNTVFQDYALFPHMNVAQNVDFGLSLRHMPAAVRRRQVAEALDLVGLADKAAARVQSLSGGQRQRVALARAIICQPRLLLLDEPLSALDAHLRGQMQMELKRLQRDLGTTFVMVTHDQTEALSISDRIVVMNRGRIEQIASPAALYDRPASRFVAEFIGAMNLLPAQILAETGGQLEIAAGGFNLRIPKSSAPAATSFLFGLRPEDVQIVPPETPGAVTAMVEQVAFHGHSLRVHLRLSGGLAILADVPRTGSPDPRLSDQITLSPRAGASYSLLPA